MNTYKTQQTNEKHTNEGNICKRKLQTIDISIYAITNRNHPERKGDENKNIEQEGKGEEHAKQHANATVRGRQNSTSMEGIGAAEKK